MCDASRLSKVLCHAFELFIVNVPVNISQSTPRRFSFRTFRNCYYFKVSYEIHTGSEMTDSSFRLVAQFSALLV